ncbi:MAG: class I adenylate-forming enzyme family protein [Alphaproteobacteria bacterium]|nr:class I adenylate-forming enzyme family protein [Alphaproteobacteria bacterium]
MSSKLAQPPYPASTIDILAYHAVTRAAHIAVFENGNSYRYDQLYNDLCKTVSYLRGLKLRKNPKVAVAVNSLYLHLILTLGLEALGICTMSYASNENQEVTDVLEDFDLILCTQDNTRPVSNKTVILDQTWLTMLEQQEPEKPLVQVRLAENDPYRIIKTSGTTGSLKTLTLTWGTQNRRLQQFQFLARMTDTTRYVVALGFSIQAYHTHCTACLRVGGTCISDNRMSFADSLKKHEATHVTLIPHALIEMLDKLPADYEKPINLRVFTIGAQVSQTIRQQVSERLATSLIESYATNEAAYICTMQADGIGAILPGVELEVMNEAGEAVYQQPGIIRMRSEMLITSYRNDKTTSERMFKDGWFYPGDLGILGQDRIIKLIGRADDQLNIRGIKVAPQPIEEAIVSEFDFEDAALCLIPNSDGVNEVWLAIVPVEKAPLSPETIANLTPKITAILPNAFGETRLIFLDKIPRTATGKVQRGILKQALQNIEAQ